jgi:hypothetical protein
MLWRDLTPQADELYYTDYESLPCKYERIVEIDAHVAPLHQRRHPPKKAACIVPLERTVEMYEREHERNTVSSLIAPTIIIAKQQ